MAAAPRLARLPFLLAFGLGMAALVLLGGCTAESSAELKTYAGVNAMRQEAGLPPLVPDPGLLQVARARSDDMAANGYFSHDPPDGCNYICLMDTDGVPYRWAGENIAWNDYNWARTADVALQMWRNSAPHYANITNCHYERFATGVAKAADGKIYYAMVFEGNRAC